MALAIRATLDDIVKVCNYLATKPTGATTAEAKAVLDNKHLDSRKIAALRFWGLLEDSGDRLRLTDRGRRLAKDKGAKKAEVLLEVAKCIRPYAAVIERAAHKGELTVTAADVAAQWHDHFKGEVSEANEIINDQAVCFFQIAEGADLGAIVIGRKGAPTRLEFDAEAVARFANGAEHVGGEAEQHGVNGTDVNGADQATPAAAKVEVAEPTPATALLTGAATAMRNNRVFITHGRNKKILDQVKDIVGFGKFVPVVAAEHETAAKPVPDKVMDDMRGCAAAVIHVGAEGTLYDKDGNEVPQLNGNVLIEIGAAMALYGRNFVLLVEEGVKLPSNLQGLYECRYQGDELSAATMMKLLKAFNEFV